MTTRVHQGKQARRLPALVRRSTLLCLLPACSLVFGTEEAIETEAMVDAGATGRTDASAFSACGPSMAGSIAYYSFDEDDGVLLSNAVDPDNPGTSRALQSGFINTPLETAQGPEGCGPAASLNAANQELLEFQNEPLHDVVAVDFWVYLDASNANINRVGVLSKDSMDSHNGDAEIALIVPEDPGPSHFVVRIQREFDDGGALAKGNYYLCSGEIVFDTWHHLAFSADGLQATLFVDGTPATETIDLLDPYGPTANCGDTSSGRDAHATQFFENQSNWIFGANTSTSPNALAKDFMTGRIDEVRFRHQAFTQEDAEFVFGNGRAVVLD